MERVDDDLGHDHQTRVRNLLDELASVVRDEPHEKPDRRTKRANVSAYIFMFLQIFVHGLNVAFERNL